jgi:hypothetical protein
VHIGGRRRRLGGCCAGVALQKTHFNVKRIGVVEFARIDVVVAKSAAVKLAAWGLRGDLDGRPGGHRPIQPLATRPRSMLMHLRPTRTTRHLQAGRHRPRAQVKLTSLKSIATIS